MKYGQEGSARGSVELWPRMARDSVEVAAFASVNLRRDLKGQGMLLDEVFGFPKSTGGERARYLIIVARDQSDLWQHLRQTFAGIDGVEVLLDRRHGGWWQFTQSREYQERGADRRRPPNLETDVRYNAFQVVPRQVPTGKN